MVFQQLLTSAVLLDCKHSLRDALRSLTQPCMTACCIYHNTYDPGILPGSVNQCILGNVYLRSHLSRELFWGYACFFGCVGYVLRIRVGTLDAAAVRGPWVRRPCAGAAATWCGECGLDAAADTQCR